MLRIFFHSPLVVRVCRVRPTFFFQRQQRLSPRTAKLALRPFSSDHDDEESKIISSTDLKLVTDEVIQKDNNNNKGIIKESSNNDNNNTSSEVLSDIPGAQTGGKKLAIVYTCTVCGTRSAKQFTEQAYRHGVVMVRCPGCENLHLIADRLGFFEEESWDIEKAMTRMGEQVTAINDDNVFQLTLKDVLGDKMIIKEDDPDDTTTSVDSESKPKK